MNSLLVLELLFVVNPYSLFLQFSKAQKFEKEEKCCNLFLLCMGKTQRLLSDMVANKRHQRAPPLLQVAFQTFERRPFDKWTNDFDFQTLGNISTWECSHSHVQKETTLLILRCYLKQILCHSFACLTKIGFTSLGKGVERSYALNDFVEIALNYCLVTTAREHYNHLLYHSITRW